MGCVTTYRNSAPVATDCPQNDELVLFSNSPTTAVFRSWGQLLTCISIAAGRTPLKGITGRGLTNDPITDSSFFQSVDLVGLAASGDANDGLIMIYVDGVPMQNFGNSSQFTFDNTTGLIDISPNTFPEGSSIYIDLNQ